MPKHSSETSGSSVKPIDRQAIVQFLEQNKNYEGDDLRIKCVLDLNKEAHSGFYEEAAKYEVMYLM